MRPTMEVLSANLTTVLVEWMAVQSCVKRAERDRLRTQPCDVPKVRNRVHDVRSPILTT